MGFFQELKEDLSQAVNELLPEEETGQEVKKTTKIRHWMLRWLRLKSSSARVRSCVLVSTPP